MPQLCCDFVCACPAPMPSVRAARVTTVSVVRDRMASSFQVATPCNTRGRDNALTVRRPVSSVSSALTSAPRLAPEEDHAGAGNDGDHAGDAGDGNGALLVGCDLERTGVDHDLLLGEGDVVDDEAGDADGYQHDAEDDKGLHRGNHLFLCSFHDNQNAWRCH